MSRRNTERLPAGQVLTVTADAGSSGTVRRVPHQGDTTTHYDPDDIAAGETKSYGPFTAERSYEILSDIGQLTTSFSQPDEEIGKSYADAAVAAAGIEYNFEYDFAVDGGTGTIPLRGDNPIPSGFVIVAAFKEIITPLDSADHTATAAITTGQAAGDIKVATIVSNAFWATADVIGGMQVLKKTTAERIPSLVVAVQDLTAGKFTLHIDGFMAP